MPSKRGPGRPKLGAEARSVVVPVRLTKAQYKAISALVRDDTISGWVRAVIDAAILSGATTG